MKSPWRVLLHIIAYTFDGDYPNSPSDQPGVNTYFGLWLADWMATDCRVESRQHRVQSVFVSARLLSLPEFQRARVRLLGPLLCRSLSAEGHRRSQTWQDDAARRLAHRHPECPAAERVLPGASASEVPWLSAVRNVRLLHEQQDA